jgi:hypothetical protein
MTPFQALQTIPAWAKVAGALVVIAGGLMTFGDRWVGIPASVEALQSSDMAQEIRIDWLEEAERRNAARYVRIICLLTLPADVPPIQAERACP